MRKDKPTVRIEFETMDRLREYARASGKTSRQVAEEAIQQYLFASTHRVKAPISRDNKVVVWKTQARGEA